MSKDKNAVTDEDMKALEESVNGMKDAVEQFKFAWGKPRPSAATTPSLASAATSALTNESRASTEDYDQTP